MKVILEQKDFNALAFYLELQPEEFSGPVISFLRLHTLIEDSDLNKNDNKT